MGDDQFTMTIAVPPIQFYDVFKPEVGNQIANMMRHQNGWRHSAAPFGLLNDRTQRGPVQMIKVGMGHEHEVNRRQIAYLQARLPQALQDEKPLRKIGIDDHILTSHLNEKT